MGKEPSRGSGTADLHLPRCETDGGRVLKPKSAHLHQDEWLWYLLISTLRHFVGGEYDSLFYLLVLERYRNGEGMM